MPELVWINGEISSLTTAKVNFLDRGYLFGDGVYEAIRVYQGKGFTIPEHLERLERSLKAISIKLTQSMNEIEKIVNDLIHSTGLEEAIVYIQVTRGSAPRNHIFPERVEPTLAISVFEFTPLDLDKVAQGIKAITLPDERWAYPWIKSLNLLPNVLAKQKAHEHGAAEAILVRSDQTVSEGASSNIFVYYNDTLITPPADERILRGITRDVTLALARELGINVLERDLLCDELRQAEEIFITSTGTEILPVTELDGRIIGNGLGGKVTQTLIDGYRYKVKLFLDASK